MAEEMTATSTVSSTDQEVFTPITNQDDLNKVIGSRVRSLKKEHAQQIADLEKQIADLTSAADASAKKYADYDKQLAEKDAKIKGYESHSVKQQIAHEFGLPYGAADYLKGDDEKSIRESAETFRSLMGSTKKAAPQASTETASDKTTAAFKQVLANLKGAH